MEISFHYLIKKEKGGSKATTFYLIIVIWIFSNTFDQAGTFKSKSSVAGPAPNLF